MSLILAYLAGVIDSDGTIGIKRNTYSMRVVGDSTQATFSERICVKQVSPEAVNLLYETFGGCQYVSIGQTEKSKSLFVWQITDKRASVAISALLPFLLIKHPQAKNCIRLREIKDKSKLQRVAFGRGHIGASCRSLENTNAMQECYLTAKTLNFVGKEK